jgi:pyruvate dehydrogenase E2 component (dihydrolipoamide acetyltransferase)
MAEFLMPKLGADMTVGRLVAWRKKPGDLVQRGDIIAEVETDKGVIEVEVFESGVLKTLLVEPGTSVEVGRPLAIIQAPGEPEQPLPPRPPASPGAVSSAAPAPAAPPRPAAPSSALGRLAMSPAARRRARELDLDPSTIQGTGPHGAITLDDVERAALARPSVAAEKKPAAIDRAAQMRQAIAAAMSRSKREIPHYYLSTTIDMQRALAWLAEQNRQLPVTERLLYSVLLLKAVALALREVPELNSTWLDGRAVAHNAIHVGVAISLRQGGLVAPALHHADQLPIQELMRKFRDLVQRARTGALRSSEISDPTITVTSLGEQGVEGIFAVIYPPQTAIVGFGKLVERPWTVEGRVVSRPLITATLSADHRVSDGHRGARFLSAIDRLLQEPEKL